MPLEAEFDGAILRLQEPLLAVAREAQQRAYAPYSQLGVGAAVLTAEGRIFSGCNVENASYGLTSCAERNAIAAAVSGGMQRGGLVAVALVADAAIVPCGACLQVIAEFAAEASVIFTEDHDGKRMVYKLEELLPVRFRQEPAQQ